MILGTDMTNHFESLQQFQAAVSVSTNVREWSSTLPLLCVVMHLAGTPSLCALPTSSSARVAPEEVTDGRRR
jgi:hypothetical protein